MWTVRTEELTGYRGLRCAVARDSHPATVAEVYRAWQADPEFRTAFTAALAGVPYTAFRWESPAATADTLSRPFECVLLDSPALAREPDPGAFAAQFAGGNGGVAVFPNLSGDATLVVPCPLAAPAAYGHLAAFLRLAPDAQRHALWSAVGGAVSRRVGARPVWLGTAGAGVSWLHVRLDDRPKYYGFAPYKRPPSPGTGSAG